MELTSVEFVFSLPIVALVYYIVPSKVRQYFLLLINLLFYASFSYRHIVVVVVVAFLSWLTARMIAGRENENKRRVWLSGFITILVAILVFFKFGTTFTSSIVAPLGISYFTLQSVSYVVDVYRRNIETERSFFKILVYLSFFPTITSGPIYRYKDFRVEHNRNIENLSLEYDRTVNGIIYTIYGYFLKLVIAARAGIAVDKVFGDYRDVQYGWVVLAVVAILYSIQIFADFAGYSAIVIGIAQILGYSVPENFVAPYLSLTVKEFWGRWHVSLSSWLKDYIYIPLGGNRKGRIRKYLNIVITFAVSGLWHGVDGLHFLVWGLIHGLYQIIGDLTKDFRDKHVELAGLIKDTPFHHITKRIITFSLVTIAWVFFRTGVKDALIYLCKMITTAGVSKAINGELLSVGLSFGDWTLLVASVLTVLIIDRIQYTSGLRFDRIVASQGIMAKSVAVITMSLVILIFGVYGDRHDASYFIYRGF